MPQSFNHGYALLIGVGACGYAGWSLPATVRDMAALRDVLVDPTLCAYPDSGDHMRLLHDDGATGDAIVDGLHWLRTCAEQDPEATVVVFYSGHGWLDKESGRYYLIPHNATPFDFFDTALPAATFNDALRAIPAKRLLVFIDSCHAEGMATAKEAAPQILPPGFAKSAPPADLLAALKEGEGRAVFTSSRGHQESWVRTDKKLSIFTHHLLEALQGAANQPGDTVVRLSHLMNHLDRTVPVTAMEMYNAEQRPFANIASEDFPVALLCGGKGLSAGGWRDVNRAAHAEGDVTVRNLFAANVGEQQIIDQSGAQIIVGGQRVDTGGGAFVGRDASVGGAFVGRDQVVGGDKVSEPGSVAAARAFAGLTVAVVQHAPSADAQQALAFVQQLEQALRAGADEEAADCLADLAALVPAVKPALAQGFSRAPLADLIGPATRFALRRLA